MDNHHHNDTQTPTGPSASPHAQLSSTDADMPQAAPFHGDTVVDERGDACGGSDDENDRGEGATVSVVSDARGTIAIWTGSGKRLRRGTRTPAGDDLGVSVNGEDMSESVQIAKRAFPSCNDVLREKDRMARCEVSLQTCLLRAIRTWIQTCPQDTKDWNGHVVLRVPYHIRWWAIPPDDGQPRTD